MNEKKRGLNTDPSGTPALLITNYKIGHPKPLFDVDCREMIQLIEEHSFYSIIFEFI